MNCSVMEDEMLMFSNQIVRSIVDEVLSEGRKVIRIHTAWQLQHGEILLYEYSSINFPTSNFTILDSLEDYNRICEQIHWVK
ncbi:hypothetical protein [Paenibacillus sp. CF384]|uniref:hypothetical protein n=1 Tax=Paenibacillus sp. CF384 TaxID=1884382 RepID=UPI000894486B|nr:hypothetical protein [Paenibacillus sp. CF384]SDW04243.1 hypothetical protein SAMN05518855_100160 [Paenibacillus sp. CF384]